MSSDEERLTALPTVPPLREEREVELERVNRYLRIAVVTRFLAIAGVLAAIRLPQMHPIDVRIFVTMIGIEIAANLTYFVVGFKRWPKAAFHVSGLVDVVAIGSLVYLTGGTQSHFIALFALVIVFNCIFYGWTGASTATIPSIIAFTIASAASPQPMDLAIVAVTIGAWAALTFLSAIVGEREETDRKNLWWAARMNARQAQQITTLYETSNSISNHMEAEALLSEAVEKTQELATQMWGEVVTSISLIDEQRATLNIVRVEGPAGLTAPSTVPLDALPKVSRGTLLSGEPFFVSASAMAELRQSFGLPEASTAMGAPIKVGEKTLGTLGVRSSAGAVPTTEQLELLTTIANHVGSALGRVQAVEHEQKRRKEAIGLFELARSLKEIGEVNEILRRISASALEIADVEIAGVFLISGDRTTIDAKGWAVKTEDEPTRESVQALMPIPLEVVTELINEAKPTVIDIDKGPKVYRDLATLFGARSAVAFPIYIREIPQGLLVLAQSFDASFSIAQFQIGEAIGGLASVAVENARLFQAEVMRSRENAAMLDVAKLVAASLDRREVLEKISEATIEATGAKWCSIFLIEDQRLVPETFRATPGTDTQAWHLEKLQIERELATFLREGRPILIEPSRRSEHVRFPEKWLQAMHITRATLAPLVMRNEALGMLMLEGPADESNPESALRLIEGIAFLAAAAIDNANRFESEKEAVAELKKLDRLKTEFVSTASHELRSPLTSITGFARTLLRGGSQFSEEQRREFLEVIDNQAKQLARLIDDLLTVSKIEEGEMPMEFASVQIEMIARDQVTAMKVRTALHDFVVDFPTGFPAITADESKMIEVISNLIDNAIKYSPQGGTIAVSGQEHIDHIEICVSDEGVGIPLARMDSVFEKFFQTQDRPQAGGAGLGLYIVRRLVEAHGGRIWARPRSQRGTEFVFTLPKVPAANPVQGH
ncbi:MAG: ATP-binding protein [Actinomycetota bacterium]|nr:GAF domain-containing protein [Actinomycetota bacterium]